MKNKDILTKQEMKEALIDALCLTTALIGVIILVLTFII